MFQRKMYLIAPFLFLLLIGFDAVSQNKISVRELFYRSSKSAVSADTLFEKFKNVKSSEDAFFMAYKGMSQLMICFHSYNPYTKFKYFSKGKESLEAAIRKDPTNIEYRFLRLSVQLNTPSFLGYNSNIKEDKLAIFNGVKNLEDRDLLERISKYTSNAKKLSVDEKVKVKQALLVNKNYSF